MEIPSINHPNWGKLVQREIDVEISFMAAKMLLMKLSINVNQFPGNLEKAISEIHNLYTKNPDLPNVQKDIQRIFFDITL